MPRPSITQSQLHAINNGGLSFLDAVDSKNSFTPVKFTDLVNTLEYVAAVYVQKLSKQLDKADSSSSGQLADKTIYQDVVLFGSVYTVSIETLKYAKFVDEGVNGWQKKHGSPYSFKKSTRKRGEPFSGKSEFVESLKKYLTREGQISAIKQKVTVSARESKRAKITDATTKSAIRAAAMIKRFGIKPTHYWKKATEEMNDVIIKEFSAALKVDIINNLT
jgi:hypothetical protein